MTMELYKVTVEYMPPTKRQDWEKRLAQHVKSYPTLPFDEQLKPNQTDYYVAVHPEFGAVPLIQAGTLALKSVVGPSDAWEKFEAQAVRVERVGSVAVAEAAEGNQ